MLLDGGERLGTSFTQFRNSVQTATQIGPQANHLRWEDRPAAEMVVAELLKDISIRHDFDECMDIPEGFVTPVKYELNRKSRAAYAQLRKDSILQLESGELTAVHAAALRTKLLQLLSGAVYYETGKYEVIDSGRYELIIQLIQNRRHSLTFFLWKHQRDELCKLADKAGINYAVLDGNTSAKDRSAIVKAYQEGFFQTLFMHPQTGAHGLTLTKGTSTIWASPIAQADVYKQGGHRTRRGGQTQKTETVFVEAQNSIEHDVYEMRKGRTARLTNFLSILQSEQNA